MRTARILLAVGVAASFASVALAGGTSSPAAATAGTTPSPFTVQRSAGPIVLTGQQLPAWSRAAATGVAQPYPSGAASPPGDGHRTTHNGTITVPTDVRAGVDPDRVAAYRWTGAAWEEIAVQIDQRFPNFLANGRSSFSVYSGTDLELTYAWAPDAHATGEEAWKKVAGQCSARYPADLAEVDAALAAGSVALGPGEAKGDLTHATADPVPTFDDDDELAFEGADAGPLAPAGTPAPAGTDAGSGQAVRLVDPLDPAAQAAVYLFLRPGGSSTTAATSQVVHTRAADADRWLDRTSFPDGSPEALGTSNTAYGPNLTGTVCDPTTGLARPSTDRFPVDAMTVSTPTYRMASSGRWTVRDYRITKPGLDRAYGPDLIDRWKGRAFQQSPDSSVSLVGFEDEQVNWEANSALLGWRSGPVRTIREVWGADSGTNVTKTETFYRSADTFHYHLRVHPIPPDGLYTSWDYNPAAVARYYSVGDVAHPDGVAIDGRNDEVFGNVDAIPVSGQPAFTDVPDPTLTPPSAILRPEEVAGAGSNGAAVYTFELLTPLSAGQPLVVPYYRDDACLDDGTGDAPVARPYPGESGDDARVRAGYVAANGGTPYEELQANCTAGRAQPFQGAIGTHGLHFFATGDSDNGTGPEPVTEVDGQQWRFAVPMTEPTNVAEAYGSNVQAKVVPAVTPFGTAAAGPSPTVPEAPFAILIPVSAVGIGYLVLRRRWRRQPPAVDPAPEGDAPTVATDG